MFTVNNLYSTYQAIDERRKSVTEYNAHIISHNEYVKQHNAYCGKDDFISPIKVTDTVADLCRLIVKAKDIRKSQIHDRYAIPNDKCSRAWFDLVAAKADFDDMQDVLQREYLAVRDAIQSTRPTIKVTPHNSIELRAAIMSGEYSIGEIDVSNVSVFSGVFEGCIRDDWDELKYWDIQAVEYDPNDPIKPMRLRDLTLYGMFKGSNINDSACFDNWFNPILMALYATYCGDWKFVEDSAESWLPIYSQQSLAESGMHDYYGNQIVRLNMGCDGARIYTGRMFEGCRNFTGVGTGIENWDLSNVTNAVSMFEGSNFKASVAKWGIGLCVRPMFGDELNLKNMFKGCRNFNSSLQSWRVYGTPNLSGMFEGCVKFRQHDLSGISTDVLDQENYDNIFEGCKYVKELNAAFRFGINYDQVW